MAPARLLGQGTFGASMSDINTASTMTYAAWFSQQQAVTPSLMNVQANLPNAPDWEQLWFQHAISAPDQLRQRVAFAMSEIIVASLNSGLSRVDSMDVFYNILVNDSLGNFRTLIDDVSHSSAMGLYLTFYGNAPPDLATGSHADENYAREIMQLFTVGLWKLNQDGSLMADASGNPIPTYVQADVTALAGVFTGWLGAYDGANNGWNFNPDAGTQGNSGSPGYVPSPNYVSPMVCNPQYHDGDLKTIIGGTIIPAGGTCASDMKAALDTLFNHPNVGPFIGKQLIQRLVTSNPSAGYVSRVAAAFNNDGTGVRGNLMAVAKAILTDTEAVTPTGYGKLREPLLKFTALWRAFSARNAANTLNGNTQYGYFYWPLMTDLEQDPNNSPSVFNFFKPNFKPVGPAGSVGLVGPEFEILDEFSIVQTSNDLETTAYLFRDSSGASWASDQGDSNALSTQAAALQTADWESLADDPTKGPAPLVDQLNLVLMAGQMPTAMRTTLINYLTQVTAPPTSGAAPNYKAFRVIEGASLVVNSPQFAIQQ